MKIGDPVLEEQWFFDRLLAIEIALERIAAALEASNPYRSGVVVSGPKVEAASAARKGKGQET